MEGHAIHTESCLHIQQDEDDVYAGVTVQPTVGRLPGTVLPAAI